MTTENDARVWLRDNGYSDIADRIDEIMAKWQARGAQTRRNWWDVLAGTEAGAARTVEGVAFPILAVARDRKGWAPCEGQVEPKHGEVAPSQVEQQRWDGKPRAAEGSGIDPTDSAKSTGKGQHAADGRSPATRDAAKRKKPRRRDSDDRDMRSSVSTLSVERFAQLKRVAVPLTELVVLVGPQATGKSLVLELLKLAIDRNRIVRSLRQHGFKWDGAEEFAALYFGGGFERSWTDSTRVAFGSESLTLKEISRARAYKGEDAVFYIPAHRTLAIAEGWPRSFAQYQVETPFVARRFSEELLTSMNRGLVGKGKIFPHDRRLKDAFRRLIDEAVFHGATLRLDTSGMRKEFVLEYEQGRSRLPFMAWTAGQREFTPLLLGLYHLLPAGGGPKKREVQWAILEEPEMGLHPKAVVAVMAVVLDLLARGYRVAMSTHSPTVLEVVWGMSRLKGSEDGAARLCKMMGLPVQEKSVLKTAQKALTKRYSVIHLQHEEDGGVVSADISKLDPGARDPREWEWGGLTGFSARVADAIAGARAGA